MPTPGRKAKRKKGTSRAGVRQTSAHPVGGRLARAEAAYREAREQQAATAEILRAIARSPADVQPVLDAMAGTAARLCGANDVVIRRLEAGQLVMAAHVGSLPITVQSHGCTRATVAGRAVLERRTVHVRDILSAEGRREFPEAPAVVRPVDFHTILAVPLLRNDGALGVILLRRVESELFSKQQVALLESFADQAVIAIENARLFNETKEALDRQTATAGILNVIASSPSDVQPVFDAIVNSAIPLMGGFSATLTLLEEGKLHLRAYTSTSNAGDEEVKKYFPVPVETADMGRAVRARVPVAVTDFETDPHVRAGSRELARARGFRAVLFVPLIRNDVAIGTINVTRREPGAFTDHQVGLLRTFADQAVIAIENARLFNGTKEALEQQTATGKILKAIAASPSNVQPVLDAVAEEATRMCAATQGGVLLASGEELRRAAYHGPHTSAVHVPIRKTLVNGRAYLERRTIHVPDVLEALEEYPDARENQRRQGFRAMLSVPLLDRGQAVGTINVWRTEPRPFSAQEIKLLETFADQSVIAIQNTRLFNETREALERQTATAEILKVISSSTTDTQPVFEAIVRAAVRLFPMSNATIFMRDGDLMRLHAVEGATVDEAVRRELHAIYPIPFDPAISTSARAMVERRTNSCPDTEAPGVPDHIRRAGRAGRFRSNAVVPLVRDDEGIGSIVITHPQPGYRLNDKQLDLLRLFADQAVIAIENVRLFREIQEKSAQLEVANRHKSEFLANMSHELRTPLNAIIGFSEVLMEKMFGEVNEKQADYLKDIHESGRHLLSLINDILDLSKIEAGRMELELATFDLRSAISNAMTLVRERAQRQGVQLGAEVDPRLGEWRADERKVKQILLNLLSNAVKFTPEGGRVDVSAKLDTDKVEIAVKDSGVGISVEDQAKLFEEFRQVGADAKRKAEGTGLGLALTKKFVELHGGAIRVDSAPGSGSTFSFSLPSAAAARPASSG